MAKIGYSIVATIAIFVLLALFSGICSFYFWKSLYTDSGNGPEIFIASLLTIRMLSLPIAILSMIAIFLYVKNKIKSKGILILVISLFLLIPFFFLSAHFFVSKFNIEPQKLIKIVAWPRMPS
jgi:hypothetical protein